MFCEQGRYDIGVDNVISCFNSSPTSLAQYLIDKKLRRSLVHIKGWLFYSTENKYNCLLE